MFLRTSVASHPTGCPWEWPVGAQDPSIRSRGFGRDGVERALPGSSHRVPWRGMSSVPTEFMKTFLRESEVMAYLVEHGGADLLAQCSVIELQCEVR